MTMLNFIMILFGISSAFGCFRKAREAEQKGEKGTASYYALIAVLILINVIFMYIVGYKLIQY